MNISFGEDDKHINVDVGQVWKDEKGRYYLVAFDYYKNLHFIYIKVEGYRLHNSTFRLIGEINDQWTKVSDSFTISWRE